MVSFTPYSDGYSSFPLTVIGSKKNGRYRDAREIALLAKEGPLTSLSKSMISGFLGNSPIFSAKVFCLSDYHSDPFQKFVRAQIINEICVLKRSQHIVFLLEGQGLGLDASEEVREALIGSSLIDANFSAYGWDNMNLLCKGIKLIQKTHQLVKRISDLEAKFFSKECTELKEVKTRIQHLLFRISKIAKQRDKSLYQAIDYVTRLFPPDTDVYVIAGGRHFDLISLPLSTIPHCVIYLRSLGIKNWQEWEQCVEKMYYSKTSNVVSRAIIPRSTVINSTSMSGASSSHNKSIQRLLCDNTAPLH